MCRSNNVINVWRRSGFRALDYLASYCRTLTPAQAKRQSDRASSVARLATWHWRGAGFRRRACFGASVLWCLTCVSCRSTLALQPTPPCPRGNRGGTYARKHKQVETRFMRLLQGRPPPIRLWLPGVTGCERLRLEAVMNGWKASSTPCPPLLHTRRCSAEQHGRVHGLAAWPPPALTTPDETRRDGTGRDGTGRNGTRRCEAKGRHREQNTRLAHNPTRCVWLYRHGQETRKVCVPAPVLHRTHAPPRLLH